MCFSMHAACLRLGGGDSLGCRGQRLCGSGLLASGGVLELPRQTKGTPSSVYCTRLHEKRSRRRDTHAQTDKRTHCLSASIIEPWESFLHTPTHDGGERGEGSAGNETLAGDQSSIASSWSAKSSNMLPMSSKMETVVFLLERELAVGQQKRKNLADNETNTSIEVDLRCEEENLNWLWKYFSTLLDC